MKVKIDSLNTDELQTLGHELEILTFPNDFNFNYEQQIPTAGIALVEGALELLKRSKVKHTLQTGNVLGIHELLSGVPLPYSCRIKANSKIILIGKSYLLMAARNKSSFISRLLLP